MSTNLGRSDPYQCMTEPDLVLLKQHPRGYQFQTIDHRVRTIEKVNRRIYTELGLLVLWVEEFKLFEEGCDSDGVVWRSMEHWLQDACPYSRSYALDARTKIKILRDSGTPLDQLQEVPRCNIQTLTLLPPNVLRDDPTVIEDAKVLSEECFRGKMQREYPNSHIEDRVLMRLRPTGSQRTVIEQAVELATRLTGCKSREEALEAVCASYILDNQEEQESNLGHDGTSIREASEAAKV